MLPDGALLLQYQELQRGSGLGIWKDRRFSPLTRPPGQEEWQQPAPMKVAPESSLPLVSYQSGFVHAGASVCYIENNGALYACTDGLAHLLAEGGAQAPGLPNGVKLTFDSSSFRTVVGHSLPAGGSTAMESNKFLFVGELSGPGVPAGSVALYLVSPEGIELVALAGDALAAGGPRIARIHAAAVNQHGTIVALFSAERGETSLVTGGRGNWRPFLQNEAESLTLAGLREFPGVNMMCFLDEETRALGDDWIVRPACLERIEPDTLPKEFLTDSNERSLWGGARTRTLVRRLRDLTLALTFADPNVRGGQRLPGLWSGLPTDLPMVLRPGDRVLLSEDDERTVKDFRLVDRVDQGLLCILEFAPVFAVRDASFGLFVIPLE